jgi:hypothetical protein
MIVNPRTSQAYQLFHNGILALSRAELQGIRVDLDYIQTAKKHINKKINDLEQQFYKSKFFQHWKHTTKGEVNINSNYQLAHFLYGVKKIIPTKTTTSGKGSTDEEALQQLNLPELSELLEIRKLKKICNTYLESFEREQVKGYIHPFYNLHLVRTFRSCIAKGTKILSVRDFQKFPEGVPIELIKTGDYVYCFDDNLNPAIQKVKWAGKTGYKEVIRIHYVVNGGGGKGYLDVTPEHKIRLIDGSYVQAKNLIGDFRKLNDNKHIPKIRTLSCKRVNDTLRFTGHLKCGNGLLEHRLIYSQLIGELKNKDIIHHKDGNHLNHNPKNLEKTNLKDHASYHNKNASIEVKNKRIQTLKENRHKIKYKKGLENHNSLKLSKFNYILLLAKSKGHITHLNYDFGTIKKYLNLYSIDPEIIKLRYDKNGMFISKKRLIKLSKFGRSKVQSILGHNYYKLLKLYKFYGIDPKRKWANQYGKFQPGNHIISKIEWIHKKVDVYDIELEKYHNFFANQICVHNSADSPNFQNIPKRDKEAMKICRSALFPRPGHQLVEVDFSGLEVRIAACYHNDPVMIKYINDPKSDMHSDMAKQIFIMDKIDKSIESHYTLRQAAKNGFVFPEFYGDYYKNCAIGICNDWIHLPQKKWKSGEGIQMFDDDPLYFISDHLISKGIKSFDQFVEHIKEIEYDFWNNRFSAYQEWKERWYTGYQKYGYIDMKTGFRCSGLMSRNDIINYPVQGAAFHCLLWSFIETDSLIRFKNLDSKLVGQIHDSMILDVNPDEREYLVKEIKKITCERLPATWDWIIVPLDVDVEVHPVDGSWAD